MPEEPKQKDPSINVKNIVEEAVQRLDDLRKTEVRRIDEKIDANNEKYQIQFTAAKEAVGIASTAQKELVAQALGGTKEAITKNDANTDKRFDLLSEKIDGIGEIISKSSGAQGIYVTHTDLSAFGERLQANIETMIRPIITNQGILNTFMNSQQGQQKGIGISWGAILGAVGLIGGLIAIFFALNK